MTTPDFEATADAFGLLADPVRVEIVDALWHSEETPVPYSDVRDAVGLRDSGRFNYHLSKLTDHFVEKTADGYRLRPTGLLVVNAVYAGSYVDAPSRAGIDVDGSCPRCNSALVGEYDAGMFRVSCADCDSQLFILSFSPQGVARRDDEELLAALSLHARAHTRRTSGGLCPFCGGSMLGELELDADTGLPMSTLVVHDCQNCGATNRSSVGFSVLEHPVVSGFLHEHGVTDDVPPWQFEWCLSDEPVTVESRDPPRVAVDVTASGTDETLRVTVDADGRVAGTERVDAGGQ